MPFHARSGFRHVRICNDCTSEINKDGLCACPSDASPWRNTSEITLCADEKCEKPTALAEIARFGNGAFRLKDSKVWYNYNGKAVNGGSWARPRREGDAALIAAHEAEKKVRAARAANIAKTVAAIETAKNEAARYRKIAQNAAKEATYLENRAGTERRNEHHNLIAATGRDVEVDRLEAELAALRSV